MENNQINLIKLVIEILKNLFELFEEKKVGDNPINSNGFLFSPESSDRKYSETDSENMNSSTSNTINIHFEEY